MPADDSPPGRLLVITGTDTGVGKTHVACWLVRRLRAAGLRPGAYKPVCSGAEEGLGGPFWDDVERLFAALDGSAPREQICPQRLQAPLAPPVAAAQEGRTIDESLLFEGLQPWRAACDVVLVEGAGGWCCPFTEDLLFADFAARLRAPVLVVAANRLGVVSQTLLTVESIRRRGLVVAGVVLNDLARHAGREAGDGSASVPRDGALAKQASAGDLPRVFDFAASNAAQIVHYAHVPLWGRMPFGIGEELIRQPFSPELDLRQVLGLPAE